MADTKPNVRRKVIGVALVAIVGVVGTFVGIGSIRTPTGPADGTSIHGTAASPAANVPDVIRVASFNIHSGRSETGHLDLTLTARTLEGFDLAGLYEVRGGMLESSPSQAEQLAKQLGEMWLFSPTEKQYWRDDFGNALVTRLPVTSWQRLPLPTVGESGARNVLVTRFGDGQLTVLLTHIARHADQEPQLKMIARLFLEYRTPVILMGDLNATSDNPVIKGLLADPSVINPLDLKHPDLVDRHIDWILARGVKVIDAGTRELGASDHPLVWAELALRHPATQP